MTLEQMKNVDIRTVDRNTLVEAAGIEINIDLPKLERMRESIKQLGNPYCFKCGRVAVKVKYPDTAVSIDDRVESLMRTL